MNSLLSGAKSNPHGPRKWLRRALVALPLLCLLVFGTLNLVSRATRASADTSLMPIKGHVPAMVRTSTLVGATDSNQSLTLSVGLQLRNVSALKAYADNSVRSRTGQKPQHLTPAQIAQAFAPLASSQQDVATYLQSYGFTVTKTLSQHLVVDVQGTVANAENAFHIQINNYRSAKGQTFYAPATDPSVPANLAGLIQNIAGLSNTTHFTHPPVPTGLQAKSATLHAAASSVSCITQAQGSGIVYLPSQLATAYNLTGFYNAGFHGEGQTIGLVEFDDFSSSDISNYASCYGGSHVPVSRMKVDGGSGTIGEGAIEDELDIENILSATPDLAALDVFEAPNSEQGSIDMWAQIINADAVPVVSTSWGECEYGMNLSDMQQENSLFTIAAAQGQTIVAATGDNGTNDCGTPLVNGATSPLSVDDPAAQPYVTGVGGTTLTLNNDNSYNSESVWNNGLDPNTHLVSAGGGGISIIWAKPSWQTGPGVGPGLPCQVNNSQCREVPDVSLNADPNSGGAYLIYCTVKAAYCTDKYNDTWWPVGGTSAAAPMWAAFAALTNEKSLHDGGFNIGFINPYLYQIDQNLNGTSYASDFHDVASGNNDGYNDGTGTYSATADYDMATGLGSYNAWNLGQDLEKLANAKSGSRGAPANTKWYFAEGALGNDFDEYLTLLNPNTTQANVSVQYLFENKAAVTKAYTVPASTRSTLHINDELGVQANQPLQSISMIVTSDVPIVAERPMYFNTPGLVSSGTDVLGATNITNTSFYFADGDSSQVSGDNSREFLTILNPSSSETAMITATYYSGGKVVGTAIASVQPLHRGTIEVGSAYHGHEAIQVTSTIGVVVERPIYSTVNVPTAGGTVTGAASTVGATTPGTDWVLAEGHTANSFQENLVLANFGTSATTATIKLEYTNGSVQSVPVTVNAESQYVFDVNHAFLHPLSGCGCSPTADVSAEVTSATPIVVERVMYFHYQGSISGITDVVAEPAAALSTSYSFAEGYTANSFQEWLTLQNPNASSEVVAITLFFDGTIVEKEVTLPAHSRTTFNINNIVAPIVKAYPLPKSQGYNVSIDVQALSGTVLVERPLYFNYNGHAPGGTDVIGYNGN